MIAFLLSGLTWFTLISFQNQNLEKKYTFTYIQVRKQLKKMDISYTFTLYIIQIVFTFVISYVFFYFLFLSSLLSIFYSVIIVLFIPYIFYLIRLRQYKEYVFDQVIYYVNSVLMSLKEKGVPYVALKETLNDLHEPLYTDVLHVVQGIHGDPNLKKYFHSFENKYNYSIVSMLHLLLIQINDYGLNTIEPLLFELTNDLEDLMLDLQNNKMVRKQLVQQFIMIVVGSSLSLFLVKDWFMDTYTTSLSSLYTLSLHIYVIGTLLSTLYLTYFYNTQITKE